MEGGKSLSACLKKYEMENNYCICCQTNLSDIKCDIEGDTEGMEIFICRDCLDLAQDYFIFVCLECGSVYLRAKDGFIDRLEKHKNDPKYEGLKEAFEEVKDEKIIQGLRDCLECNPFKYCTKLGQA
jgi:hypothetical protein